MTQCARGMVYLVGAGPGDPGLITVRGRDLLRCADVVVYDRLVCPELLCEAAPGAELVDVGKTPGHRTVAQEAINALLIDRARQGRRVVRLKGGDPFVFGRGAEELDACRAAGVVVVVVPGVSSALAGPAAADIPLTERFCARSFAVFTARSADGEILPELADEALTGIDTLVFLMGRARLAALAKRIVEAGRAVDTPAACIENATTSGQRVAVGTLATIAADADRAGLDSPVVIVVGAVAARAGIATLGTHLGVTACEVREPPRRQEAPLRPATGRSSPGRRRPR